VLRRKEGSLNYRFGNILFRVAESSPYQKFVGPNPVKPRLTAAEIAARRMRKLKEKLGIKVS